MSVQDVPAPPTGRDQERVRVPKAAELIAADLRRQIVRGDLAEGAALPPETKLMQQFGVSRPTLREAIRILESERLISVRRGARGGARVHRPQLEVVTQYAGLILQADGATLKDVYAARKVIEPPLAGMVAERRPERELQLLKDCVRGEETVLGKDSKATAAYFARFQKLMGEASGNTTLGLIATMLASVVDKHVAGEAAGRRGQADRTADDARTLKAHKKFLKLVEAGDVEGAEQFWRRHMDFVGRLLMREYGATTVVDLVG